jgi:hypothetical protein
MTIDSLIEIADGMFFGGIIALGGFVLIVAGNGIGESGKSTLYQVFTVLVIAFVISVIIWPLGISPAVGGCFSFGRAFVFCLGALSFGIRSFHPNPKT